MLSHIPKPQEPALDLWLEITANVEGPELMQNFAHTLDSPHFSQHTIVSPLIYLYMCVYVYIYMNDHLFEGLGFITPRWPTRKTQDAHLAAKSHCRCSYEPGHWRALPAQRSHPRTQILILHQGLRLGHSPQGLSIGTPIISIVVAGTVRGNDLGFRVFVITNTGEADGKEHG